MDMHSFATCTSSVVLSVTRTTERSHVVVLRQIPDPEPVVEIQVLFSTRNKDTIPVFHSSRQTSWPSLLLLAGECFPATEKYAQQYQSTPLGISAAFSHTARMGLGFMHLKANCLVLLLLMEGAIESR